MSHNMKSTPSHSCVCLHGFIYRLVRTLCLYEYKWEMWPSKYAAQKQPLFLCVVAHSHHSVVAVSFDCTQQNRFMNKYENLYMCPEIRRILVFHVQRLYFFHSLFLTIWSYFIFLSLHVCILAGLLCTQHCFRKHKVHVVVLKWNLTPLYVIQASFVCLHALFCTLSQSVGLSLAAVLGQTPVSHYLCLLKDGATSPLLIHRCFRGPTVERGALANSA